METWKYCPHKRFPNWHLYPPKGQTLAISLEDLDWNSQMECSFSAPFPSECLNAHVYCTRKRPAKTPLITFRREFHTIMAIATPVVLPHLRCNGRKIRVCFFLKMSKHAQGWVLWFNWRKKSLPPSSYWFGMSNTIQRKGMIVIRNTSWACLMHIILIVFSLCDSWYTIKAKKGCISNVCNEYQRQDEDNFFSVISLERHVWKTGRCQAVWVGSVTTEKNERVLQSAGLLL